MRISSALLDFVLGNFILICTLTIIPGISTAETRNFTQKIQASMDGGIKACRSRAIELAQQQAVQQLAENLRGKEDSYSQIVADRATQCCVKKVRAPTPRKLGNGQCEVTVRVRVDVASVKRELRNLAGESVAAGEPVYVGGVVRLLLDGKLPGAESNHTPLDALTRFEAEFGELGIEIVNLTPLHDSFVQQKFGKTCSVTGGDLVGCEEFTTYAESARRVLENTRWAVDLADEYPDVLQFQLHGGWVLIGQVSVTSLGRNPEGYLYRAKTISEVRLFNVRDGRVLSTQPYQVTVESGDRQDIAIDVALSDGIRRTAVSLAEKIGSL